MEWKLEESRAPFDLTTHVELRISISPRDFMNVRLDEKDYALAEECEKSEKLSDKLLWLECITRKIENSNPVQGRVDVTLPDDGRG